MIRGRLLRFRFAVLRAALAFALLCSLCGSTLLLSFLRVRSNSTVLCSGVSCPFAFWLATVRFSPVCVWCCRALVAAQLQVFGVPFRVRVLLFSRFFVFACVGAALLFCFGGAARLRVCGGGSCLLFAWRCSVARFRRWLWREVSAIQTTRAQKSQHTAQQGAAPDRLQPCVSLVPRCTSGFRRRVSLVVVFLARSLMENHVAIFRFPL